MEEKLYIGCKVIKARRMGDVEFERDIKGVKNPDRYEGQPNLAGYMVEYPDGYQSWSPQVPFELAYREVTSTEKSFMWPIIEGG